MAFLSAETFLALMAAREKQDRGEPLTEEEQMLLAQYPEPPVPVCGCGCGKPMPGASEQYTIGGKFVRSDCWYDGFGKEIDEHPIISPRLRMLARRRQPSV